MIMKTQNAKPVTQNAGKIRRYTLHATRYTNRGFTILEALVSIFILTLTVVAPMSIASSTLFNSIVAKEQVTAFYLAQEAIEGVRSIRDGNGLANPQNSWLQDLPLATDFRIDTVNWTSGKPTISACPSAICTINYDSSTHLYQHVSGIPTNFIRTVRIDSVPSNPSNEVAISVTVTWNIGKISRTFVARENMFNWQ